MIEHEYEDGCLCTEGRAFTRREDAESTLIHVGYSPSRKEEEFYVNPKFGKKDNTVGAYIREIELLD